MGQEYGAPAQPNRGIPGWAWLLIVPCGCLALLVPVGAIVAAILFPVFAQAREKARQASCLSNIKQQTLGVLMYAQDYDEKLPPAATWMDATMPYVKNDSTFRCPSVPRGAGAGYGYAYDMRLSLMALEKVRSPKTTVAAYDSTNLAKNATDAITSLPNPPRHSHGNNKSYLDGHAKWSGPSSNPQ